MARPALLPDLLRQRARVRPDAVALAVDGGGSLTLREWHERSDAAARGLTVRGVAAGDRVALVFDNRRWLDLAVAYLAVLEAGAVAVPMTRRFPAADLLRALRDCHPALVVGPDDLAASQGRWARATLADLEAETAPRGETGPQDPEAVAEWLYPAEAMRRPVPERFTHADIAVPHHAFSGIGTGTFLHAFPVGTLSGQEALRLPLLHENAASVAVAVPAFAPEDFRARAVRQGAVACGLTPAMARALRSSSGSVRDALPFDSLLVLSRRSAERAPGAASHAESGAETAPLAAAQDGMVWHEQFTPGSFNLAPPVRRYRGDLDVGALEAALSEIVRRHPALRTTFTIVEGRGVQRFPPHRGLRLPVVDLSGLVDSEQRARLAAIVSEARRNPFDLVSGPLFAPTLVRLAPDDHVIVIRTHHAVYDDWSVGLFRRELSVLYSAFASGQPSPLPELRAHLPDVARAQDSARREATGEAERRFWREELEGAPVSVQLPIDDPARPVGSPHSAPPPISLALPPELSERLRALARSSRATPFMVLLAAFGVVVQRFTGQHDLLVSTLAANRPTTELEDLIGCFGKKVLVRLRLSDDLSFPDLVTRTRRALMGALAHQSLAYEAVVQEFLAPPATAHGLAPQIALKFQAAITPHQRLRLRGLTIEGIELPSPAEPAAHFLSGETTGHDRPRVPEWGAGLYAGAFLGVSVVESDAGLRLVTEGVFHRPEVERLLGHYLALLDDIVSRPDRPVSAFRLIGDDEPGPPAMTGDTEGAAVWHATFASRAQEDADRVAVVGRDGRLTFADLAERAERAAAGLGGENPTRPVSLSPVREGSVDLVVRAVATWKAGRAIAGTPNDLAPINLRTPAPAYVIGGVPLDHGALLAVGAALQSAVYPPDERPRRVCVPSDPASGAFVRGLLALLAGHALHLVAGPPATDPQTLLALLADGEVDVVDCGPADIDALVGAGLQSALDRRKGTGAPAPLVLAAADSPIPPEQWTAWRQVDGAEISVVYGPADCAFGATAGRVTGGAVRPGIGRPLPGVTVEVVDDAGRRVPSRALGTLRVGGRPQTGPAARALPDGTLELVAGPGTIDLRGFAVEPARIEAALSDCPDVAFVTVLARPSEFRPGDMCLVAHVVARDPSAPPRLADLRRWLWRRLPGYAWPATMVLVDATSARPVAETAAVDEPAQGLAAYLASAWAEASEDDRSSPAQNYWQSFALLDVLAESAAVGDLIPPRHVTRNRTLDALATDLAAARDDPGGERETH